MHDFLVPHHGEYRNDDWAYAGDGASAAVPLLRWFVCACVHVPRGALDVPTLSGK